MALLRAQLARSLAARVGRLGACRTSASEASATPLPEWAGAGQEVEEAQSPPAAYFTSLAAHERAASRVFRRSWLLAARAEQVASPGQVRGPCCCCTRHRARSSAPNSSLTRAGGLQRASRWAALCTDTRRRRRAARVSQRVPPPCGSRGSAGSERGGRGPRVLLPWLDLHVGRAPGQSPAAARHPQLEIGRLGARPAARRHVGALCLCQRRGAAPRRRRRSLAGRRGRGSSAGRGGGRPARARGEPRVLAAVQLGSRD